MFTDKTLASFPTMSNNGSTEDLSNSHHQSQNNNNNDNERPSSPYLYGDTSNAFDYLRENDTWQGPPGADDATTASTRAKEIHERLNVMSTAAQTQLHHANSTMKGLPSGIPLKVETYARPRPYTGPSSEVVLAMRQQHLSAGQYHFYEEPLMLVEGQMQYCFDEKGRAYLDGYSNVAHVGHCHPVHVRAISQASGEILSNTRYLHPNIVEFTRRLKEKVPSHLSVVYLVNSGSEANDLAMRLARCHTKRNKIACLSGAYHGTTLSCSGVSTSLSVGTEEGSSDFSYASKDVVILPVADPYRGRFKGTDPDAGKRYVQWSREIIQEKSEESDIAGFIAEAVQGVAGQIVYPPGYLKRMFDYVKRIGGVNIMDEVQTGFGRCGSHFWAFEAQGASPDILVLGKPIGNGFPLGAVLCTREISRSFDGTKYFNTFGGNPLACAAGLAVLNILERDNMQQNALRVGIHFIKGLQALQRRHKIIGDVRGVGTFLGVELVRDRETLEPATEETKHVMEQCKKYGVLVGKGGVHNNVIRFKPPLCFTAENADVVCAILDRVLTDLPRKFKAPSKNKNQQDQGNFFLNNGASIRLDDEDQQKEDGEGGVFPRNSYVYSGSSVSLTKDVPSTSFDAFTHSNNNQKRNYSLDSERSSMESAHNNYQNYQQQSFSSTKSNNNNGGAGGVFLGSQLDEEDMFRMSSSSAKLFNFQQQSSGKMPHNSAAASRASTKTQEGYNWHAGNRHNPSNTSASSNNGVVGSPTLQEAVRRSMTSNNNTRQLSAIRFDYTAEPPRSALRQKPEELMYNSSDDEYRHNNNNNNGNTPRVSFKTSNSSNNNNNNNESGMRRLREGEYDAMVGGFSTNGKKDSSIFRLPQ